MTVSCSVSIAKRSTDELRELDWADVVGIAESDPELHKAENSSAYRDLTWMTEEQLLGTQGLQAVAVEVNSGDDRLMDITGQCIDAGMHVHVNVEMCDNGLIVFEYPRTTVTIRTASLEVEGYQRRQLVVCGDQGTIDIRPLETFNARLPQPLKLRLALSQARDSFKKGYQEVSFPQPPGRYDNQLIELAQIIRGERENPYSLEHELIVQKCLLTACGYPTS